MNKTIKKERVITDEMILQYTKMVESFLNKSVQKNWNEASTRKHQDEISLGNTGMSMADIRAYLQGEVFIALKNYSPDYNTKESTFVYGHLNNRVGSLMKKLTNKSRGYGFWSSNIEEVLGEVDRGE